jgi:CelD/BcsL family acetyltransferase involved in cellulose biosynthesis
MKLESETVTHSRVPDAMLQSGWRQLWRESDRATLFNSPEFFDAWRSSIGSGIESGIVAVWSGSRLTAVLPIMRTRVRRSPGFGARYDYDPADSPHVIARRRQLLPVRQISPLQSLAATALQPMLLCRSEDLDVVTCAIARWLSGSGGWDQVIIPAFDGAESDAWQNALASSGLRPFVDRIDRSFRYLAPASALDDVVRAAPGKFRQNMRRAEQAAISANVSFWLDDKPGCVERHLGHLTELAAASWKANAHVDRDVFMPFQGRQQRFMQTLMAQPSKDVQPFFVIASLAGSPTAILFGAISGGSTMTLLLLFRDDKANGASPGLLVMLHALRHATHLGLKKVDLNASSGWVQHLVNETRPVQNVSAFASTLRGRGFAAIRHIAKRRSEQFMVCDQKTRRTVGPAAGTSSVPAATQQEAN